MSMTIKQAFEKLTMVCGAALKNPFFVQRNLHDAFADIAANIDAGGGSSSAEDVSYDNTDSGLTAENVQAAIDEIVNEMPSAVNYSTNEQDTGLTWIDGKKIYQKTFVKDSTDISGTLVTIDASALNIYECINIYGTFDRIVSAGKLTCIFNSYEAAGLHSHVAYSDYNNMINFTITLFTGEATSSQKITILYTKSAS